MRQWPCAPLPHLLRPHKTSCVATLQLQLQPLRSVDVLISETKQLCPFSLERRTTGPSECYCCCCCSLLAGCVAMAYSASEPGIASSQSAQLPSSHRDTGRFQYNFISRTTPLSLILLHARDRMPPASCSATAAVLPSCKSTLSLYLQPMTKPNPGQKKREPLLNVVSWVGG